MLLATPDGGALNRSGWTEVLCRIASEDDGGERCVALDVGTPTPLPPAPLRQPRSCLVSPGAGGARGAGGGRLSLGRTPRRVTFRHATPSPLVAVAPEPPPPLPPVVSLSVAESSDVAHDHLGVAADSAGSTAARPAAPCSLATGTLPLTDGTPQSMSTPLRRSQRLAARSSGRASAGSRTRGGEGSVESSVAWGRHGGTQAERPLLYVPAAADAQDAEAALASDSNLPAPHTCAGLAEAPHGGSESGCVAPPTEGHRPVGATDAIDAELAAALFSPGVLGAAATASQRAVAVGSLGAALLSAALDVASPGTARACTGTADAPLRALTAQLRSGGSPRRSSPASLPSPIHSFRTAELLAALQSDDTGCAAATASSPVAPEGRRQPWALLLASPAPTAALASHRQPLRLAAEQAEATRVGADHPPSAPHPFTVATLPGVLGCPLLASPVPSAGVTAHAVAVADSGPPALIASGRDDASFFRHAADWGCGGDAENVAPPASAPPRGMPITEWAHRQYDALERVVVAGKPCVRLAPALHDDDIEPFSDEEDGAVGDALQQWAKRRPLHPVLAARVAGGGNVAVPSMPPAGRPARLQIERVCVAEVARPGGPPARIVNGHLLVGSGSGGTWQRMEPREWARLHSHPSARPAWEASGHPTRVPPGAASEAAGRRVKTHPGPWLSARDASGTRR
jgi:hypothetical protein